MIIDYKDSFLVIVDVQEKLIKKISNNDQILSYIKILIDVSKVLDLPVIITEQYPRGLGATVEMIENSLKGKRFDRIEKTSFSCLGSDPFNLVLKKIEKKQVILTGIETHICILQTSFDLIKKGYDVFLIDEATGSRNDPHKQIGIERMKNFGVTLTNIEMLLFELIKDSKSPYFKKLSSLVNK